MQRGVPAGAPRSLGASAQVASEPLACETLPLYSIDLDGVFASLRGLKGPPDVDAKNSNSPTLLALESQIRANPFDKQTWDSLLAENPSTEAFERVLEIFPTSADFWRRLAEFELQRQGTQKANSVYKRSLCACSQLELWMSYVKFVYCTGSVSDFRLALTRAVEMATGPLVPTEVEQRAFRTPGGPGGKALIDEYADLNVLRSAFQSCLGTAIAGLDGVWAGYCAFERSVGSNPQLSAKILAPFEQRFADARKAHAELARLTRDIDWLTAAVPLTVTDKSRQAHVDAWRSVLAFEKTNPLKLSPPQFCHRVSQAFQTCLLSCAFHANIWFDFFQFLLAQHMPTRASEVLRRAIDRFLPGDELLQIILAEFLEDRRLTKAADAVYRNALSATTLIGAGPEGGPLPPANFRTSPVLLLRYLDFIRRSYGISAWRACFEEVSQLEGCSWQVFIGQARTEWRLTGSETHALGALRKGALRYRAHPQFVAAYADMLLDMKRLDGARELLRQSVLTLQAELGTGSRLLWKKWIRLEAQYGDASSLRAVVELRAMQRLNTDLDLGIMGFERREEQSGEGEAASPAAIIEQETLCNLPHKRGAGEMEPREIACAKLNIRKRQFMGGDSLQDLYELYTTCDMAPKTSMLEALGSPEDTEAERLLGAEGGKGRVPAKDEEDDIEEEAPAARKAAQTAAQYAMIARPDIDSMAAFHPELSILYHPDSVQQAPHGAANSMEAQAAREIPIFAPPKILCDIVALLPKANGKLSADPDMVDYLMATLQATRLPSFFPMEHRPLVVKDLLALRHSQLHCLQAARRREGRNEDSDAPGGHSERDELSDASSAEDIQRPALSQPASQLAGQVADFSRPTLGTTGVQVAPAMYGAPHLMMPADSMMQARRVLTPAVIPGVRPIWTGVNMLPGHYTHLAAPQLHPAVALPYGISMAARPMQGVPLARQPLHVWRVPEQAARSFQPKKKTR
ncbi:uncharacterized protein LOC34617775 [Cyclospora cayetanensis]|uniref:Uncharacterized protein LOC34617775 n=1 Tax=Cyclospora cayetanensis TaxID=88456 RepID=A0A6P6S2R9_9EIME|nr:uncharacterized protein LOC34617775 [Cyclospora cayetanensis]